MQHARQVMLVGGAHDNMESLKSCRPSPHGHIQPCRPGVAIDHHLRPVIDNVESSWGVPGGSLNAVSRWAQTAECSAACPLLAAAVLAQFCAPGKLRGERVGCSTKLLRGVHSLESCYNRSSSVSLGLEGSLSCGSLHPQRRARHQGSWMQQSS